MTQQNRFDYTDFTGYRIIRLVRSRTVFCLITVYTDTVNFRRARAHHRMYRVIIEWVWQLQASSWSMGDGATVQSRVQSIPRHSQTLDTRRICLYLSRWQARCFSVHTVMNLYLGLRTIAIGEYAVIHHQVDSEVLVLTIIIVDYFVLSAL